MEFICYEKCSTCKKAKQWLEKNGLKFTNRDIKSKCPTEKELTQWIKRSGLDSRRFFNTSGMKYRELGLAQKLETMTEEEKIKLLSTDGMLIKRPLLVLKNTVLIGFKEKEWESLR